MDAVDENEKWVVGVVLGLLGSIAINTGNNIQSLGLKHLKEKQLMTNERIKNISCHDGDLTNDKLNKLKWAKKTTLPINFSQPPRTVPMENVDDENSQSTSTQIEQADEKSTPVRLKPISSTRWVIGTIIFVTGSLLNFASYAFAAQSMLASLESIQFVTNLLFGKFLLGSRVTKQMYIGTCLTVSGTVVAVQFSSKVALDLNTSEMKKLYMNPLYIVYLCLMIGSLFLLDILYRYFEKRKKQNRPLQHTNIILPLVYSVWSALFGTQSVVQAKVLAELLAVQSTGEEDIFRSWFTYVTIILWLVTVAVWLKRLNDALSTFDPLFIIPLLQCSFIFFTIVSGGIFFQEFNEFTSMQWLGFCFGVLIMFFGLILLTPSDDKDIDEILQENIYNNLVRSNENGSELNIVRPPITPTSSPRIDSEEDIPLEQSEQPIIHDHGISFGKIQEVPFVSQAHVTNNVSTPTTHETSNGQHLTDDRRQLEHTTSTTMTASTTTETFPSTTDPRTPGKKLRFAVPRRSFAENMYDTVKGAVEKSWQATATETQKILTSPNGTAVLTTAMSSATEEHQQMATKRREKVRKICSLMAQNNCMTSQKKYNDDPMFQLQPRDMDNGNDECGRELGEALKELQFDLEQFRQTSNADIIDKSCHDYPHSNDSNVQFNKLKVPKKKKTQKKKIRPFGNHCGKEEEIPNIVLETRTGEKVRLQELILEGVLG